MNRTPLKTLFALAVTSLTLQSVSAITVDRQLEAWKAEVEEERDALHGKFKLAEARKLQKASFIDGGVVWAQRYTSSWGGWIYTDWDVAKGLHHKTIQILKKSLYQLDQRKPISEETFQTHQSMMGSFRKQNAQIRRLLHTRLELNVHCGLELDAYNEAYQAYLVANLAGAKKAADLLKIKADYHYSRYQQWSGEGAAATTLIRQIGYQKVVDPNKFDTAYQHALAMAKSGRLTDTTTVSN